MCGICGKINLDRDRPVERETLLRMRDVITHRGPDDAGIHLDGNVGLAMRRLAIIDLSPDGHQPMCNEDGTVWIVYNGEVYNFPELRPDLERKGHTFRSKTDTEVVLHLYEEHGTGCLQYLRGMFAFAIWDANRGRLFMARDRLGQKPLAYCARDDAIWFGSEIKSILQDPAVPRRPDIAAIDAYLTYSYVPHPHTAFEGIKKLPPAHYLTWENGSLKIERYWGLSYANKHTGENGTPSSFAEAQEQLLELLKEATRMRMISDVPLGAFLSGGIDSSSVVALMSMASAEKVKTYTISFEEEEFDEAPYARMVAERFGTQHHEFTVKPDAVDVLPRLVWHYNEPYSDSSAVPTYYVSKITREHVTVALNGDGGDEAFAGYPRYARHMDIERAIAPLRLLPTAPAARAVERLFGSAAARNHLLRRVQGGLITAALGPAEHYQRRVSTVRDEVKERIYTPGMKNALLETGHRLDFITSTYEASDALDVTDTLLNVDTLTYLPCDLLVKVDIASMAVSLEARSPYLDHHVVEFAASLPSGWKLNGREGKHVLKKALEGILPREILYREKRGFGVPINRWLRNELADMARDLLLSDRAVARGYFQKERVREMLDAHIGGESDYTIGIWALLNLELWHEIYIDSLQPSPCV